MMNVFIAFLMLFFISGCISMPEVKRVDKKVISQHINENKDYSDTQKEKYKKLQESRLAK